MASTFNFSTTPEIHFGIGKINLLPGLINGFGKHVLLVTGASAFRNSIYAAPLFHVLEESKIKIQFVTIDREPSPEMIDAAVTNCDENPDVVVAIGGGSVLDAGKAIAAMLPLRDGIKNYLEGVGNKIHPGTSLPFIAVPTTSGTGSEATKNAVISETGSNGYKKSLRHNNFVPKIAILDPQLTIGCPLHVTASSGMDAFTQLLESYLSTAANPITDALAFEGLKKIAASLRVVYDDGSNLQARSDMALAAYLSGVTLANAGLGVVHGFASAIGGYFEISHGVICSSLMASANKRTVQKLRSEKSNLEALKKYSDVGKIFSNTTQHSDDYFVDVLLSEIEELSVDMKIPTLKNGGVLEKDFDKILDASDNKNNPVKLNRIEMQEILKDSF